MKNKKTQLSILAIMFSATLFGQVGINTVTPKATLDVVGKPTDINSLDGLIPPRITAEQLNPKTYSTEQTGALIYVTEPLNSLTPTAQTVLVVEKGYYLFDGIKWIPFANRDTLYDVVERGNYAGRYMSFTGDATSKQGTREAGIGYNQTTKSYFFGGMNPSQSGVDNLGLGFNTLGNLTTGRGTVAIGNNAFSTSTGGVGNEYNTGAGLNVGSLFKGDHSVALGVNTLNSNWFGEQNTAIGQASMSSGIGSTIVSYNTAIGSNSLRLANQPFGNIAIGRDTGVRMGGKNNVLIGNGLANATLYSQAFNGSNKLLIHSFALNDNGTYQEPQTSTTTWNNPLIYGDFSERWVRFNGKFQINPSYINVADSSYNKVLLHNSTTGAVGVQDYIQVPTPPSSGNFTLQSVNGVMNWVAN